MNISNQKGAGYIKSLQNAEMDSGKGQELCTRGKLYDKIGLSEY